MSPPLYLINTPTCLTLEDIFVCTHKLFKLKCIIFVKSNQNFNYHKTLTNNKFSRLKENMMNLI